ncbi:TIGR01620 family protein [Oleisolibacter albus]|uniref:TIGR01620 family protein n=1 Tax=Oleisolibacter albus TaxID=2171757 RepID=UPI001EFE25E4|nr:TIGR01620 family protein [Oleisolibacter albus]
MEFDPARAVPAPAEEAAALDAALDGEGLPPPSPRRRLRAARVLAGSLAALVLVAVGFDTADLIGRAFALSPWLGGVLSGLGALAVGSLGLLAGREARAYFRLQQVDALRTRALSLRAAGGHGGAAPLMRRVAGLYAGRGDMAAAGRALTASVTDAHDDRELLDLTEATLLAPLDRAAYRLVLKASRDVALGTTLSPSALLDTALVLWRTMRLLREVAGLYAARPGLLGSARLLRRMVTNMGIAGLAESGDSLVAEALGAGVVGAVSSRLAQGLVNGLLVARIGLTAMHLCRPLPFAEDRRPRLTDIRKALLALPKERR